MSLDLWKRCEVNDLRKLRLKNLDEPVVRRNQLAILLLGERYVEAVIDADFCL